MSVCFLDRKVRYRLSPSLPIQTTKSLMSVPTGMGKPLKVDFISLTNKPYWLYDFCHRLQRPQVGWGESLSTRMIHICLTHLLHANQLLLALNIYDWKLPTPTTMKISVSAVSHNKVNLKLRALTSPWMLQCWENGGALYVSLQSFSSPSDLVNIVGTLFAKPKERKSAVYLILPRD